MPDLLVGSLIVSVIIYAIFHNIQREKGKLLEMIVIFIITTISGAAFLYFFSNPSMAGLLSNTFYILFLAYIINRRIKILKLSMFYGILVVIIFLFSSNLVSAAFSIAYLIFPYFEAIGREGVEGSLVFGLLYMFLTGAIAFTASYLFGQFLKTKLSQHHEGLREKVSSYLLVGAIITLLNFYMDNFIITIIEELAIRTLIGVVFLLASFSYLLFAIFAFSDKMRTEMESKLKDNTMRSLTIYTEQVERNTEELRKFKHDNLNMILGFKGLISNKDWEGLERYYSSYMSEFKRSTDEMDKFDVKLKNLQEPVLKSVFLDKCVRAMQIGVNLNVEVKDEINLYDQGNIIDLCRIIGILMDNALEACKGNEKGSVEVLATVIENQIMIVIENSYHERPEINKMRVKGYTTKGEGRGTGLGIVRSIMAKNESLILETTLVDDKFCQKLKVTN